MKRTIAIGAAAAVLAAWGLVATTDRSDAGITIIAPITHSYAAKFVCKERNNDKQVVQGEYRTVVNIHNPHILPVRFRKKAVIALPERSHVRGRISKFGW